jgi:hypothetical protein
MADHIKTEEDIIKKLNLKNAQLTTVDLQQAAANLTRMRTWVTDLYPLCVEYEDAVFHALKSTKENPSWTVGRLN